MNYVIALLLSLALYSDLHAASSRIFVDGQGNEVTVPIKAKRIVSLRGEQFTSALVELGANVVGSTGLVKEGVNSGKPFIRGAYDLFYTRFEDSSIRFVGNPAQPDLEVIASLKPDLILVPDFAAANLEQLSTIAPSVVINIWSNDARTRYRRIAEATGYLDEFHKREERFEFRLNKAKALSKKLLGEPSTVSVAIAEVRGKRFRVYKNYGAMSYLLDELGFSQPDIIANIDGDRLDLSPEQVQSIDADFLVSSYSENFGQPVSQLRNNWDNLVPGWQLVLHAARNRQHIFIDREPMRALSFKGMEEILAVYVANIVTRASVPLN